MRSEVADIAKTDYHSHNENRLLSSFKTGHYRMFHRARGGVNNTVLDSDNVGTIGR